MLIDMELRVSPYIGGIPAGKDSAWQAATRCDEITLKSWLKTWIDQTVENKLNFDMNKYSVMDLWGLLRGQPVIIMGSGPSLSKNWEVLKGDGDKIIGRKNIRIISGLHNFQFCEERDLMTNNDYYIVLDAGPITVKQMTEGGKNDPDWYWEKTGNRTLIAPNTVNPELARLWRGNIYWFTTPYASQEMAVEMNKHVDASVVPAFNVGGNAMGAALYFARAILGCSVPIFIGMDLCFAYNHKFYPWESFHDNTVDSGRAMPWTDIFGNRVWTWPSYFGFKSWFDFMACGGQGGNHQLWINATEGGIMGAYPEGNIIQILQMDLKSALNMFNVSHLMPDMMEKSKNGMMHLLF